MSLIELLIASAIATLLLGALLRTTLNALQSQASTRDGNEMVYQARFAIGLIVAKAEASPLKVLVTPPANSTGDWFSPTMYCLKSGTAQLIETSTADTGCVGTRVIADNVSAFAVQLPVDGGPLDRPVAQVTLTTTEPSGARSVTLTSSARLGGSRL